MKKLLLIVLVCFFIIPTVVSAKESQEELKTYLTQMHRIVMEVEAAIRMISLNPLVSESVTGQISRSIEKFENLKSPVVFSTDHNSMLTSFKLIRDGLTFILKPNKKQESVDLVKKGADLLRKAAMNIKTRAEQEGLIPEKTTSTTSKKTSLPSQAPSMIAGTPPMPSPHIASPQIETILTTTTIKPSASISVSDTAGVSAIPAIKVDSQGGSDQPAVLAAIGEIASVKSQEDYFIVEILDNNGNSLEVDITPGQSTILKNHISANPLDITTGSSVHVLYTQKDNRNLAGFVNILGSTD
ncbi:MAG: hypothetical protein P9L93_05955 [Candidatus Gorgyraea atricola]|nr:hypothetical protein [Candidatus Gorgyraea atricola]